MNAFLGKMRAVVALLACSLLGCESGAQRGYAAQASAVNQSLKLVVDSPEARDLLEGRRPFRVARVLQKYKRSSLDSDTLRKVAEETSPDFGAAYFMHRVWQNAAHRALQKRFNETVETIRRERRGILPPRFVSRAERQRTIVLFVPGLLYRSKPETKGDLAGPRALLIEQGVRTELVNILEAGTVEQNGQAIAHAIRRHKDLQVILVSTSKGGPDVAYALGSVLKPEEATHVRAWVSVGGALRGSLLADKVRASVEYWPLRLYGFVKGFDVPALVDSMSVRKSRSRFDGGRIPEHIYILHYVSVPFSSTVIKEVRKPYTYLNRFGPNDGVVLLSEQLTRNGHVVLAVGSDHWFRDPEIELKTLALTRLVFAQAPAPTLAAHR